MRTVKPHCIFMKLFRYNNTMQYKHLKLCITIINILSSRGRLFRVLNYNPIRILSLVITYCALYFAPKKHMNAFNLLKCVVLVCMLANGIYFWTNFHNISFVLWECTHIILQYSIRIIEWNEENIGIEKCVYYSLNRYFIPICSDTLYDLMDKNLKSGIKTIICQLSCIWCILTINSNETYLIVKTIGKFKLPKDWKDWWDYFLFSFWILCSFIPFYKMLHLEDAFLKVFYTSLFSLMFGKKLVNFPATLANSYWVLNQLFFGNHTYIDQFLYPLLSVNVFSWELLINANDKYLNPVFFISFLIESTVNSIFVIETNDFCIIILSCMSCILSPFVKCLTLE